MAATVVNGLCATSFRPLLRQPMAVGKLKSSWASSSSPSVSFHRNGNSFKIYSSSSTKPYLEQPGESTEFDDDSGPPRWFSPMESSSSSTGSPLLLFLPGIDGSGHGLKLQHRKLGEIFDIRCLHIPAADRTPLPDLVLLVENTIKAEQYQSAKGPVYLVGESFGASLALLVASQNPDIDFVLILANPATNFTKSLVQSVIPLTNMIHNQLNGGLLHWMSSLPVLLQGAKQIQLSEKLVYCWNSKVDTVMWKMKMIHEMQNHLNSQLRSVKSQTLILTSGKDMLLTSITEGERLNTLLQNSRLRPFLGNGDPLFSDEKFDLVAAIKCASYYRRGSSMDYVADFLPPTPSELQSACEPFRWMDLAVDPVMLSTMDGKVVRGLDGIPSEGPIILVSNHMMLGLDLVPLFSTFWLKQKIELRALAHPTAFDGNAPEGPHVDVIRMTGGVPVSANNLYRLLKSKSHVLLYPGGIREALHRRGEEHTLIWPEEAEFVRMAARFGARIVPFGTVGEDDLLHLLLDSDDQMKIPPLKAQIEELTRGNARLRSDVEGEIGKQVMYFPVAVPKLPGRFYYFFGEPISTEGREDVLTNKDRAKELYLEVKKETEKCIEYLKDRRTKDPYRSLFARLVYQSYHGFDSQVPTFEI